MKYSKETLCSYASLQNIEKLTIITMAIILVIAGGLLLSLWGFIALANPKVATQSLSLLIALTVALVISTGYTKYLTPRVFVRDGHLSIKERRKETSLPLDDNFSLSYFSFWGLRGSLVFCHNKKKVAVPLLKLNLPALLPLLMPYLSESHATYMKRLFSQYDLIATMMNRMAGKGILSLFPLLGSTFFVATMIWGIPFITALIFLFLATLLPLIWMILLRLSYALSLAIGRIKNLDGITVGVTYLVCLIYLFYGNLYHKMIIQWYDYIGR